MRHTALTCTTIAIPCHSFWFKHTHTLHQNYSAFQFASTILSHSHNGADMYVQCYSYCCYSLNVWIWIRIRILPSMFGVFFPQHILAAYRTKCILHFKYWQWPRKCTHINCEHIMIWLFYRDKYKHTHWNAWLNGKAVCDKCTGTRTSRRGKKAIIKIRYKCNCLFPSLVLRCACALKFVCLLARTRH